MLSRQSSRPRVDWESKSTESPHQLLASPPDPPPTLFPGFRPALRQQLGLLSPPLTPGSVHQTTTKQSEYVESGAWFNTSQQTTKGAGHRRMMPRPFSSTPPLSTLHIRFTIPSYDSQDAIFTFDILPQPEMALTFLPRTSPPRPRKRCRTLADIDGEHSTLHKKKRRLRLFLITSRLSPQFSHPATNIVDRGNSKIAVWAKQKALGRNLLRKAAILNRIRRQSIFARETEGGLGRVLVEQEKEQEQLALAKMALVYGSHDPHTRPVLPRHPPSASTTLREGHLQVPEPSSRSPSTSPSSSPPLRATDECPQEYRSPNDAYSYSSTRTDMLRRSSYIPLPPSPLGLSNYDAFDMDDDIPDPYSHLDDEYDEEEQEETQEEAGFQLTASSPRPSRPSLSRRQSSEPMTTPPQTVYSDFSVLDPDQPVFGDYDQVEEGADAIWPTAFAAEPQSPSQPGPLSSSPDFPALFATAAATADDMRPLSPNFPLSPPASTITAVPLSPNFTPFDYAARRNSRPDVPVRTDEDAIEGERERQKNYMFMQFGQ